MDAPPERRIELRNRRGQRLVGDLALPPSAEAQSLPAVLVLHGLGGHRNERHVVAVAQQIALRGIASLRVDLANNAGESEGSFRDLTLSGEVDDATDALDFLRSRGGIDASRVGAAGHSFGGLVAMLLGARRPGDVLALALMSAVFDAPARFRQNFASREREWRARGAIDIGGGRELGIGFLDDLARWDIQAEAARIVAPTLVVYGTYDDEVPQSEAFQYSRYLRAEHELLPVSGDHTYSHPRTLGDVCHGVADGFAHILNAM